jgi:hypothetical protein
MSRGTEELCSAIEESARLVGAACSRDKIWPTLIAYGDALDESGVVFSVETGGRHAGELEYTMQVPPGIDDPYAHARSNGFVAETDHPVGSLFSDLQERISIEAYGVDYGVATGFKKVYTLFGRDPQGVSKLADIPSMPRALAENAGFLSRSGLDSATAIGIDYQNRTMNVYFQLPEVGSLDLKAVLSMLREIGLPEPDDRMLEFASNSYRVYSTVNWDSLTIQRISFAPPPRRGLDLAALPIRLEPEIEQFTKGAPYTYDGERINISVVKWSTEGPFFDFGSYYRISPLQLKAAMAAN